METICCWCLKEQGIPPKEGDSHGICQRHYNRLMAVLDEEGDEVDRDLTED